MSSKYKIIWSKRDHDFLRCEILKWQKRFYPMKCIFFNIVTIITMCHNYIYIQVKLFFLLLAFGGRIGIDKWVQLFPSNHSGHIFISHSKIWSLSESALQKDNSSKYFRLVLTMRFCKNTKIPMSAVFILIYFQC